MFSIKDYFLVELSLESSFEVGITAGLIHLTTGNSMENRFLFFVFLI